MLILLVNMGQVHCPATEHICVARVFSSLMPFCLAPERHAPVGSHI